MQISIQPGFDGGRRVRAASMHEVSWDPSTTRNHHEQAAPAIIDARPGNGHGGTGGDARESRELLDEAASVLDLRPVRSDEPAVLRSARGYRALTEEAIELEKAAAKLRDAEEQAATVRRRVQRARRATERLAQEEVKREEGGL